LHDWHKTRRHLSREVVPNRLHRCVIISKLLAKYFLPQLQIYTGYVACRYPMYWDQFILSQFILVLQVGFYTSLHVQFCQPYTGNFVWNRKYLLFNQLNIYLMSLGNSDGFARYIRTFRPTLSIDMGGIWYFMLFICELYEANSF